MNDLDLTEAIKAAGLIFRDAALRQAAEDGAHAAAPLIEAAKERQVRERIAADIDAMLTEGPWPPWFQAAVRETARIARGAS